MRQTLRHQQEATYIDKINRLLPSHRGYESGMTVIHALSGPILMKNGHELQQHKYDFILKEITDQIAKVK